MAKNPILILNYAGKDSPEYTIVMLQKISLLYLNKITKKNQLVTLGKLKIKLPKALHKYRFYYSLQEDVKPEDLIEMGIINQQISDQMLVIRP